MVFVFFGEFVYFVEEDDGVGCFFVCFGAYAVGDAGGEVFSDVSF